MIELSQSFVVEWDRLFRFQVGENIDSVSLGGMRTVLERGLRQTASGYRRQYRFLLPDGRFDWFDEETLLLGKR